MPFYKRRRKVNPNDKDVKVTFIDEVGDHWEEFTVFHHNLLTG
jgi:ribonucleoside-diphosphate reductase alpha chain